MFLTRFQKEVEEMGTLNVLARKESLPLNVSILADPRARNLGGGRPVLRES